jgi:hypothetical protein
MNQFGRSFRGARVGNWRLRQHSAGHFYGERVRQLAGYQSTPHMPVSWERTSLRGPDIPLTAVDSARETEGCVRNRAKSDTPRFILTRRRRNCPLPWPPNSLRQDSIRRTTLTEAAGCTMDRAHDANKKILDNSFLHPHITSFSRWMRKTA